MTMKKRQHESEQAILKPRYREIIWYVLKATAPLIMNAFNQKVIEQLLRKHMQVHEQREAKKPRELIERAIVRNEDGEIAMPTIAFKKAILSASVGVKSLNKPKVRLALDVIGLSVPIRFEKMVPRLDPVRLANGMPDLRFRPSFMGWGCNVGIDYDPNRISAATVTELVAGAGRIGVGEWRPERDGKMGTFEIEGMLAPREFESETKKCSIPVQGAVI